VTVRNRARVDDPTAADPIDGSRLVDVTAEDEIGTLALGVRIAVTQARTVSRSASPTGSRVNSNLRSL
jgi:hypothetical protein